MSPATCSLGGTIDLTSGMACWHSSNLPDNLPESVPRRLVFTARKVCAGLNLYPFQQLCWDGDRPFYRLFIVERESDTSANFRIEGTTDFDANMVFGIVPSHVFNLSDVVYLLSDAEPSYYPGPRVAFVSEAFERMTGYRSDEIVGKTPRILQGESTESASRKAIGRAIGRWERVVTQITNYRKDGTPFRVELDITPVCDQLGWWEYWFSSQRDITNEQREIASQQHRAKLESLGELAAGVAHEINTPMQSIASNLDFLDRCSLLLTDLLGKEGSKEHATQNRAIARFEDFLSSKREVKKLRQAADAIRDCQEASGRVIEIVRAMKAMSHPGTQTQTILSFEEEVESATVICRNRWKFAADLVLEKPESSIAYEGIATEISQVAINLIVNAADAIAEENRSSSNLGSITVRTRAENGNVILEVEDDGPGIPESILHRIFDPFFTTKEVGKGSGQGLAITHNIVVKQCGGEIELLPASPKGTLARVTLPLQRDEPND